MTASRLPQNKPMFIPVVDVVTSVGTWSWQYSWRGKPTTSALWAEIQARWKAFKLDFIVPQNDSYPEIHWAVARDCSEFYEQERRIGAFNFWWYQPDEVTP